jgi:hypothetical protein
VFPVRYGLNVYIILRKIISGPESAKVNEDLHSWNLRLYLRYSSVYHYALSLLVSL